MNTTDQRNVADVYLENAVENAPPVKLVRMMVDGAVRFIDRAIATPARPDRRAFVNWCQRADAIVLELRLSLVPVEGSDLTTNLQNLYVFCESRIGQALATDTHEPLHEARKVLVTLLDAWQRIETPPEPDAAA